MWQVKPHQFKKNIKSHWPFLIALAILGTLLFKNPFSERTLIPNLDPFPDTFHYVTPPRCLLQGKGWRLCRPDHPGIVPDVPPLYSIGMIPFLVIHNDPRMFYFLNLLLAGGSLFFFYKILQKFSSRQLLIALVALLYVTNYFIYWYPTLAMAENLILFLLLAGVYVGINTLKNFSPAQLGLLAAIAVGIYLTKPAFSPLVPLFIGWTGVSLWTHRRHIPISLQKLFVVMGGALVIILFLKNFNDIWWVTSSLLETNPLTGSELRSRWFGYVFWKKHLPLYTDALFGRQIPFLWDMTPLVPRWVGVMGMIGLLYLAIKSKTRWLGLLLLAALWGQIMFMASFYALDGRYIYHSIPLLLIGTTVCLDSVGRIAKNNHRSSFFVALVLLIGGIYAFHNVSRLRQQVVLNLKYAEQPWWYLSIKQIDRYFLSLPAPQQGKRFLIVAHPPFLFDYYAQSDFELLPLTPLQDFREGKRTAIWGDYDYSDYVALYQSLLAQGNDVYLTNYGLGNHKGYHEDYQRVEKSFILTQVETGCYNLCNIYRIEPTDEKK